MAEGRTDTVAVVATPRAHYAAEPPFAPGRDNPACDMVAEAFRLYGLDQEQDGTPAWNPLGELIRPGETVLLKPNMVKESHPRDPRGWEYVLTNGSVIRAVADYVWRAVGASGTVVLADAPQTDSSFEAIRRLLGLDEIAGEYRKRGLDFRVVDLRQEEWTNREGAIVEREKLQGDPEGYVAFNLAHASEFSGHSGEGRYYGADYDSREVNRHHEAGRHEYLIAGTAIKADVVISLPKLKTHKKAGITAALKNLVGINGDKNWLPHHTENGDECPRADRLHRLQRYAVRQCRSLLQLPGVGTALYRHARRGGMAMFGDGNTVVRSGNWWGNDTIWRTCLDLNKILLYGEQGGTLRPGTPANRKRHYVLVDGILAGEGNGPMDPDPVPAGMVLFGASAPAVDAACARLMSFDPEKIPAIRQAFRCREYPLAEGDWRGVRLVSNKPAWNTSLGDIPDASTLHFRPHFGWRGHIERYQCQ